MVCCSRFRVKVGGNRSSSSESGTSKMESSDMAVAGSVAVLNNRNRVAVAVALRPNRS